MIEKLINNIAKIRYPRNKLQILLILEEDDIATRKKIEIIKLPKNFSTVIVPHSYPKTKGKACNFALQFVRGEYLVIYDAEDRPDPRQLQKAVDAFAFYGPEVACLQAKLNYYNRKQNLLTAMFSIEYRILFDIILQGLAAYKLPIPLGGTSNHIRVSTLLSIGGWDAYNVTEDADLGMRLYYYGYKVQILNSYTMEEAPGQLENWLNQRCRWWKGYLQTFFVFTRKPLQFIKQVGWQGYWSFFIFVGLTTLSFLVIPIVLALVILMLLLQTNNATNSSFLKLCYVNCIINTLQLMIMAKLASYTGNRKFIFFPFYYILHTIAAYKGLSELRKKLHHWRKTKHGIF